MACRGVLFALTEEQAQRFLGPRMMRKCVFDRKSIIMLRNDQRKAEIERIRADADERATDLKMTFRWPATICALLLLFISFHGIVTGLLQIRNWQSSGVLLAGLYMTVRAISGWRIYFRRKQQKP
jgi:hypothetical protein